ncbi:MAG: hypothetical protein EBR55_02560 [Chitinophagia bacterium]|nr:hypothetical protein [Chitinophagia bacterium]
MYTDDMRRIVHNLIPPKGFGVNIIDNEHFLTVKLDEMQFVKMSHDQKIEALQYVVKLKNALEQNGAIVLITREAVK